ncbi:mitochondrial calcium uniporter isoform X2 [Calliopsis andreniformis]|uniref:mitochondrial calcium uniporter isoform X2 n=1 Tax=Calliopsis andreniformis TaxID=337506 RepID=UPI003FCE1914
MATVSFRALYVVRWYEVSRVLGVSSTLTRTKNFRNETWCRRWWHISQRSLSLTTSSFAPNLSPMLAKGMEETKAPKETKTLTKDKEEKGLAPQNAQDADVTVVYHRGLPKITVPLPSRKEKCVFTLKPISHTVGDFIKMLKREDRGIDRAAVLTVDGVRIGSKNTIEMLMEEDFRLIINDNEYLVTPPLHHRHTMESMQNFSDVQMMIGKLYETFQVRECHADMEKQVLVELETIRLELEPLEQKLLDLETTAARQANIVLWTCLVFMCAQFSGLARLTWWEYSWDIMEPVTYFVTYGTTICWVIYFLLTKQEYMLPDVQSRRHLITLHKMAKKAGLDLNYYNSLKDRAYELETTLKIIRGPLYDHQMQLERKKRERSNSSSSRSPSSSPSPSPSPSPERSLPKKGTSSEKNRHEKAIPEERLSPASKYKDTRDY